MKYMFENITIGRIIRWMIDIIYRAHTYFLSLNDQYQVNLTDKQLHFLIIGALGFLMLVVLYPLFRFLAKKHLTILITWFYVTTVLVVITFAIEIAQWYSNTGVMDFNDIVAGLAGYFVMSFIFFVIIGIIALIKKAIRK